MRALENVPCVRITSTVAAVGTSTGMQCNAKRTPSAAIMEIVDLSTQDLFNAHIHSPILSHSDLSHKRDLWNHLLECFLHRLNHNPLHLILYAISGLDDYLIMLGVWTIRASTPSSPREMRYRASLKASAPFVWTGRQNNEVPVALSGI